MPADPLQLEQTRILYRTLPSALAANTLLALVTAHILFPVVAQSRLLAWLFLLGAVLLWRAVLLLVWRRSEAHAAGGHSRLLVRYRSAAIATGLAWGVGAVLLFPAGDLVHQVFLAFAFAGLCAGAAATLAVDRLSALGFLAPTLLPLTAQFLAEGGRIALAMAFMVGLFLFFVGEYSIRAGRIVIENIRLRLDAARREQLLRDSEQALSQAQQLAHLGSFDWNPVAGELRWSDEHFRLWGLEPQSVTPSHELFRRGLHPDDVAPTEALVQRALGGGGSYECVHRVVWPDGSEHHLRARGKVSFDAAGMPVRMLGTVQDITSRVHALNALRESEELFRAVSQSANDAIITADGSGKIIKWNKGAECLFGYSEAEALGQSLTLLMPPRFRDAHVAGLERAKSGAEPHVMGKLVEFFGLRKDRSEFPVEVSLAQWEIGERRYFTGVLRDISARKSAEQELARHRDHLETLVKERTQALGAALVQAEAANRAKSVFLSNMSHELRTPLNAVIGFSRLMSKSATLSEGEKKNLAIINRAGEHLLTLINDVLELSKIDAGRVEVQEEACDVGRLAQDVADTLRPRAEQAGLCLRLAIDGVPAALRVDTTKLRQILINLLSNAVKFTARGGVSLRVEGSPVGDREVRLDFEISDTGIGIAAEDRQRIFDPFVQIVTDATSAGTGLGLTITRQYLHMLGSELSVESTPGQGSTFRFALAVPPVEVATLASVAATANGQVLGLQASDQGKRILIVDDSTDSRQLLREILAPLGFAIAEADDGVDGVAQAASFRPDLIIMDWRMLNLDGLEATRRIRAQGTGNPVKVLMLSASVFEEQKREALAAGVDDFLRKPLQEEELHAALERHLGLAFERRSADGDRVAAGSEVTAAEIVSLPEGIRVALREAVGEMNPGKIKALLARIEPDQPQTAQAIVRMIEAFRYQELWDLLPERHEGRAR